jgi:hypothetical protein
MSAAKSPVTRETNATVREQGKTREIFVTIEPSTGLVGFRAKGTRRTETLPADALYHMAVKARVERERKEKRKKK